LKVHADALIISTAVEQVAVDFKKPTQRNLSKMTLSEAKKYYAEGHFAPGSMGPKVKAIIDFLEAGGHKALITTPFALRRALEGETGTWVTKD
jgi:carbamate kinase